jgi:hypothetical protein
VLWGRLQFQISWNHLAAPMTVFLRWLPADSEFL